MNIPLENKFEKISRTLVLFILVSIITYNLYNIFTYKPTTYYKPAEKIYFSTPSIQDTGYYSN